MKKVLLLPLLMGFSSESFAHICNNYAVYVIVLASYILA